MEAAAGPGLPAKPPLPLLAGLSCVSAAALAYEILLTRLFAIVQWHHFAYMAISVALLGYGAAGTLVALFRSRLASRLIDVFALSAGGFGLTATACFLIAQALPFNALEFLWDPRQPFWLVAVYLSLFVPFFFAGICVCLSFSFYAEESLRIYRFDLLGAAAGSLGVVLALYVLPPTTVLACVSLLALAGAGLAWATESDGLRVVPVIILVIAAGVIGLLQTPYGELRMSPYKQLPQTLETMGARVIAQRSSPLGLLTVVDSPQVPLRHAPGMGLSATGEPPPQFGVFTDGEGMSALNRFRGSLDELAYLRDLTSAAPYAVKRDAKALILGAGAGADVFQAIVHGARRVDAVELNPQVVELVERDLAEFSGKPYSQPEVSLHIGEARGFAAGTSDRYDLIQIGLLDSPGASSAGLYALSESYLYTEEALRLYLGRLAPEGVLSITRWVNLPPRDTIKLFATAVTAIEKEGAGNPAERVALIRSWRTATLLVKNGAFTSRDIASLREFCRQRSFDFGWYPGMTAAEADQYNQLEQPYFFEGAVALLGAQREEFLQRYKCNIRPATDDRPYFHQFFRWRSAPELLRLKDRGGLPLLEWGYPLLVMTLVQAIAFAAILVVLPLKRLRRAATGAASGPGWRTAAYFAALALGFMFVEIAFIQKFILFLSHPLYAIAVVLSGFLLSAGLGSALARRLEQTRIRGFPPIVMPIAGIALLCTIYLVSLPIATEQLVRLPDAVRIAAALLLILPLGACMGMPFPLGLETLGRNAPATVPWAWGINAGVSVVAAVLATLLAIHFGFRVVIATAVGLYLLALACFPADQGRRA
jgi:ABC-type multidrug transport system fused ATPase/permease subunit